MENFGHYMSIALLEAEKARKKDEVPVGCVIVKDNKIIAKAHNLREHQHSVLGHAELLALAKASKKLKDWQLVDCDLYVTLEPCVMCASAISQSRIKRVIYGADDPKAGGLGGIINVFDLKGINHSPEIIKGIKKEHCSEIIKNFFKGKRK